MILRSLTSRFIFASILLLPLFLGLSAYGLNLAFQKSLLSGEEERLKSHIYLLLGAAEFIDNKLWMPEQLQEPRFNQLSSGLYGTIRDNSGKEIWRSPSSEILLFPRIEITPDSLISPGKTSFATNFSGDNKLFTYTQDILWELDHEKEKKFRFYIYHSQDEFNAEARTYRNQLWQWLGIFGFCILLAQVIILRWGLKPLKILADDLTKIESGSSSFLSGTYPSEIQPVTDNLNHVLKIEQQQRERYRTTLDDLAHSLKTPLSVIQSTIQNSEGFNRSQKKSSIINKDDSLSTLSIIADEVQRMNQIVEHQLHRAVLQQSKSIGNKIVVLPIVNRIITSLEKVYADKQVSSSIDISTDCNFFGDERDLFELLGNLLENAFKYSNTNIRVSSKSFTDSIILSIEDDGSGISEQDHQTILKRGARADTIKPGQGIGLTVALEIISSYGGSLDIGKSSLGGALFTIMLPTKTS